MRCNTYPPAHRVRKRADFVRAYDEGRRASGRRLIVFARPNELGHARLGITATRKYGNAVARNRARRLVREAFRTAGDTMPRGQDLVVVARANLRGASAAAVRDEFLALVRRATGPAE